MQMFFRPDKSGAEATAVQTLRINRASTNCAKRLDCGRFIAALNGVRAGVCHNRPDTSLNLFAEIRFALTLRPC